MSEPVFSPDGQWMWTGSEWVPAPPSTPAAQNENANSHLIVQNSINSEEIDLQKKTLGEILEFTNWTSKFLSKDYSKKELRLVFLLLALPIFIIPYTMVLSQNVPELPDSKAFKISALVILGVMEIGSIFLGIKLLLNQISFNKENDKKKYNRAAGLFGSGILAPNDSWILELDPVITKYEHLNNWLYQNNNAEMLQKLVEIEIELKRLVKKRGTSQVITAIAAGAAISAAAKSNWDGKNN